MIKDQAMVFRKPRIRPTAGWDALETRALCAVSAVGPFAHAAGGDSVVALGDVSRLVTTNSARATASIPAGGTVTFTFTLGQSGAYTLFVHSEHSGVTLNVDTPGGPAQIPVSTPGEDNVLNLKLPAGDYSIEVVPDNGSSAFIDWDLILSNGVGQSASQGAQLIGSTAGIPVQVQSSLVSASSATVGGPSTPSAFLTGPSTVGGVPAGLPVGDAIHVEAVGPTVEGGNTATADSGQGLSAALFHRRPPKLRAEAPIDGSMIAESDATKTDEAVLAGVEPSVDLARFVMRMFPELTSPAKSPEPAPEVATERPTVFGPYELIRSELASAEGEMTPEWNAPADSRNEAERASMAIPIRLAVIVPAAAMAFRLHRKHQRARRDARKNGTLNAAGPHRAGGGDGLPRWMRDRTTRVFTSESQ